MPLRDLQFVSSEKSFYLARLFQSSDLENEP